MREAGIRGVTPRRGRSTARLSGVIQRTWCGGVARPRCQTSCARGADGGHVAARVRVQGAGGVNPAFRGLNVRGGAVDGRNGNRLRQRDARELLRHYGVQAPALISLSHAPRNPRRRVRVHRPVLHHAPPALGPRPPRSSGAAQCRSDSAPAWGSLGRCGAGTPLPPPSYLRSALRAILPPHPSPPEPLVPRQPLRSPASLPYHSALRYSPPPRQVGVTVT